jgi:hypothetical protein
VCTSSRQISTSLDEPHTNVSRLVSEDLSKRELQPGPWLAEIYAVRKVWGVTAGLRLKRPWPVAPNNIATSLRSGDSEFWLWDLRFESSASSSPKAGRVPGNLNTTITSPYRDLPYTSSEASAREFSASLKDNMKRSRQIRKADAIALATRSESFRLVGLISENCARYAIYCQTLRELKNSRNRNS